MASCLGRYRLWGFLLPLQVVKGARDESIKKRQARAQTGYNGAQQQYPQQAIPGGMPTGASIKTMQSIITDAQKYTTGQANKQIRTKQAKGAGKPQRNKPMQPPAGKQTPTKDPATGLWHVDVTDANVFWHKLEAMASYVAEPFNAHPL